ncbi:MAG: Asp-tRNA(Asn)/Glu-tRNA(Gln) amidotransferase subunit GatC [Pseudomonadota bacterium]|nr:Asp-tRNA(Asn)/Glu-tRNA(Gln) amidotransferase subunit GatC [Pseudomonadota bacterium]
MPLKPQEVEKIAHLARISLTQQEIALYTRDLSNILELVEQMNSVDTTEIVPMAHPVNAKARLRPDAVAEINQREQFQSIAPQVEAGLFLVPKVIE